MHMIFCAAAYVAKTSDLLEKASKEVGNDRCSQVPVDPWPPVTVV